MDMRNILKKVCICGASLAMIASMSVGINNVSAHRVHRYHYRTHRVYRRPSNRRSAQIRKINNYLGWVKHYNSTHAKKYNSWKVMMHLDNLMNGISKPQRRSALKEMFKVEKTNSVLTSKSKKHAVVRMKPRKHAVHHYVRKRAKKTTKRTKRTKQTRRNKRSYLKKRMNYKNNSYRPSNNSEPKVTNLSNAQKHADAQNWLKSMGYHVSSNGLNAIDSNGNIVGSPEPANDSNSDGQGYGGFKNYNQFLEYEQGDPDVVEPSEHPDNWRLEQENQSPYDGNGIYSPDQPSPYGNGDSVGGNLSPMLSNNDSYNANHSAY